MSDALTAPVTEERAYLEKQHAALAQAEAAIRTQRADLARMMNDLRDLQAAIKKQQGGDLQALAAENETLRRLLDEAEKASPTTDDPSSPLEPGVTELKTENELLHQLLREKDLQIAELTERAADQVSASAPSEDFDADSVEAELRKERQQLELDRAKLKKELEQVKARNAELDEATREMEMEMSKERAEFARERIRLDRLREEVRSDAERLQREAGVRENLAPVNKLRDEINSKKAGGKLNERLHGLRNRLTDTPK